MLDHKRPHILPYLMWLLPLLFFGYQFILRLLPSLVMNEVLTKFNIDATKYGLLASAYYYGYAGFQIPCAILLDSKQPKWIIFGCTIICGISTLIFSNTTNLYIAILSRFLIGAGSAVGFLGVSKILSIWFSQENYAKMVGASFTVGLCGAIYGGKPTNLLIEKYGWQEVSYFLAIGAFLIGIANLIFLRTPNAHDKSSSSNSIKLSDFKNLFKTPVILLLGLANLLMVGPLEGFADVWGVNYLMGAYNYNKNISAELISYIFFGMLFGGPLLAFFAKKTSDCTILMGCGILMSLTFMVLFNQYGKINYSTLALIFTFLGVLCCYQVIIFSLGANIQIAAPLGVRVAFLNSINMLGGSFFHTSIGKLMDNDSTLTITKEGIRQYNIASYHSSLAIIPLCTFIGGVIIYVINKIYINSNKSNITI